MRAGARAADAPARRLDCVLPAAYHHRGADWRHPHAVRQGARRHSCLGRSAGLAGGLTRARLRQAGWNSAAETATITPMYKDNSLIPTEAVRLAALGLLTEGPRTYAELADEVRHFSSRIVGPSLDL